MLDRRTSQNKGFARNLYDMSPESGLFSEMGPLNVICRRGRMQSKAMLMMLPENMPQPIIIVRDPYFDSMTDSIGGRTAADRLEAPKLKDN
jgi:hypothetical protein